MCISDPMIYDGVRTYSTNCCEASKDILEKAFEKKESGCYKPVRVHGEESERGWYMHLGSKEVTSCYLCSDHMRKHLTSVTTIKREGSAAIKRESMSQTNFVDQLDAAFLSLADVSAAATADALKWTDLEQNVVYQIKNARAVNSLHGQSVILSLQKADGSSCTGMLSTELLQIPMIMVSSRRKRARMDESTIHINCCSCKKKLCNICRNRIHSFLHWLGKRVEGKIEKHFDRRIGRPVN